MDGAVESVTRVRGPGEDFACRDLLGSGFEDPEARAQGREAQGDGDSDEMPGHGYSRTTARALPSAKARFLVSSIMSPARMTLYKVPCLAP